MRTAKTSPAKSDRHGFKCYWLRQSEHKGRRDRKFLYHRIRDRRNTRTDSGGLRESGGLRFRKELASIRRFNDSFVGIVDACCNLRIRCQGWGDYSLPRLKTVGGCAESSSDKLENH